MVRLPMPKAPPFDKLKKGFLAQNTREEWVTRKRRIGRIVRVPLK